MEEDQIQNLLNELQQITEEASNNKHEMNEEQFEQFVVKRQNIVERLEPFRVLLSDADKQQIGTILSYDSVILQRMHTMKNIAGEWLEKRGSIREQKNAYQQVYAIDSLFIDHRE